MTAAVVTGAARGIGRAIAARLVREGWSVVINDVDAAVLAVTATEIGATAVPGDAASTDGVEALVSAALDRLGSIDVFVANAGIASGSRRATPTGRGRSRSTSCRRCAPPGGSCRTGWGPAWLVGRTAHSTARGLVSRPSEAGSSSPPARRVC